MTFGHREHLQLAWNALDAADTVEAAVGDVSATIRSIAAAHGTPQKYNHTVTTAWVLIVDHLRSAAGVRTFEEMLAAAPWLFDKRLLLHHYSSPRLASNAARQAYVPPDVLPMPPGSGADRQPEQSANGEWPT